MTTDKITDTETPESEEDGKVDTIGNPVGAAIAEATEEVTKMSHLPTRSKKEKTKSVKAAKKYKKH